MFQTVPIPANNVQTFGPNATIQLDPTVALDQQSTYIKYLQQLRRINEGDDTADAAGYSLYLLRMPVSVDPGQRTRQGYGAEITAQINTDSTTNLLRDNFHKWVVNDLAVQMAEALIPLVNATNLPDLYKTVTNIFAEPITFTSADIDDLAGFLVRMLNPDRNIDRFVSNSLSSETIAKLEAYNLKPTDAGINELSALLVSDLNRLVLTGDGDGLLPEDITNLLPLLNSLRDPSIVDGVSPFLGLQIKKNKPPLWDKLKTFDAAKDKDKKEALVAELARALADIAAETNFFDDYRFARVKLSAETLGLLRDHERHPKENRLKRWLGRLLLADAYPGEISRIHRIFKVDRFEDVQLSPAAAELLGQNPRATDLARLNRRLLMASYSNEFAKPPHYESGWAGQELFQLRANTYPRIMPELCTTNGVTGTNFVVQSRQSNRPTLEEKSFFVSDDASRAIYDDALHQISERQANELAKRNGQRLMNLRLTMNKRVFRRICG